MGDADPGWPELLRDYEAAIAEFESVARALTEALVESDPADSDLRVVVLAEESAREAVILARTRLIDLWRETGTEVSGARIPVTASPAQ